MVLTRGKKKPASPGARFFKEGRERNDDDLDLEEIFSDESSFYGEW